MRKQVTFFIIILLFPSLIYSQSPEQTMVSLTYGDNYTADISDYGEIDEYTFYGQANDVIMVRMRDETKVDAYIRIYDPNGAMIASKWSDGGLAKIQDLKLELDGNYTILAYDRNHNDVGNYGISLHQLDENQYAAPLPEIISFTDEIKEIVGVNTYSFTAEAGDVLFAQMRALTVHLECEFFIYNKAGERIFKSVNTGRLATVGPIELEENDSYQIVITDRGGNDMDQFGFTHMLLNKHETLPNLSCGGNSQSNLAQLVERKAYRLKTKAGQIPLIEARSNNTKLETSIEIYDEEGTLITKQTQTNKLISKIIPAASKDKSYLILIFDKNGNDLGDFGLQIQFLDDTFCPELLTCSNQEKMITLGGLAENNLFSIEGKKGLPIDVILTETNSLLEPHLRVFNLQGELVAEAKESATADLRAQVFPTDGKYLVLASDVSGNDIGDFELSAQFSDLGLAITGCQTVYQGFAAMANATITVLGEGNNLQYLWSNGETTPSIHVSPLENTDFSVTVTNEEGCSGFANSFVEAVDVACGNGSKVQVCHVDDNNGVHKDKCISENGVWSHLENGEGHTQCYIGPCNYVTICNADNSTGGLTIDEKVRTRGTLVQDQGMLIFPNPTANNLNIDISKLPNEEITITIMDTNGKTIDRKFYTESSKTLVVSMRSYNVPFGIYLVHIESENYYKTEQILYVK